MIVIQGLQSVWHKKNHDDKNICLLANELNISIPIAAVLYERGIQTKEKALSFLFPVYDETVYNPELLGETNKAIDRIFRAINNKEKILICGDYDVDGITATSLLLFALLNCDANVNFFLPHRVHDGYGLSPKIIDRAKKSGYSLLITVDNGTCAFEALQLAGEINLDVIVTDHHQPKELPKGAYCIINPHLPNCQYPFKELAGVGVVFKLVNQLYKKLKKEVPEKIYELFLLGTIADLVPLLDENRYWIRYALNKINKNTSIAINLLKKNAKIVEDKKLNAEDIAFNIAPQLNALGRLSDPRNGVLFFIDEDEDNTKNIAKNLLDLNNQRKKTEKQIVDELLQEIREEEIHPHELGCIVKADKKFPAGIIGLIAAKLTQEYQVPSCIFTETENGILKGSCRSISQCNIFTVLENITPSLLISFGGHGAAAGVALEKKNLELFIAEFSKQVLSVCSRADFTSILTIDSQLELEELDHKLWNDLCLLEPFGSQNKSPLFYVKNLIVTDIKIVKDIHVKLTINSYIKKSSVIFFNRLDIINSIQKNQKISIVGKIKQNLWQQKNTLEFLGVDISY